MSINKVLLSGLLACSLSACSRDLFISHNGNMPTNERIEQVKVGQIHSRQPVFRCFP